MDIYAGDQVMSSGFTYLEDKIKPYRGFIALPPFLNCFKDIIDGFYPGRVTVVKDNGKGSSAFLFSLLHNFVVQNNVSTYLITNKYDQAYVSMNLLKFDYKDYGYHHMLSGLFNELSLEELKEKYRETQKERAGKGYSKEYPLYFSRFHEYDILEICENIRGFVRKSDSSKDTDKKLVVLTDIAFDDLKIIKEIAEEYFIPVIVFQTDEERNSTYTDSQMELKVSPLLKTGHWSREVPFEVHAKNCITLVEGETVLYMDFRIGAFCDEKDSVVESSGGELSQEEINKILAAGENGKH